MVGEYRRGRYHAMATMRRWIATFDKARALLQYCSTKSLLLEKDMRNPRTLCAMGLLAAVLGVTTSVTSAQTGEGEKRGSIPIGTSQDGSGPSDGALIGGTLKPDIGVSKQPLRDVNRCKELSGTLREECLLDLGATAAGAADSAPTVEPASTIYADPRRRRR